MSKLFYIDSIKLLKELDKFADVLAEDVIQEIKQLQPVDDTTEEKAKQIFKDTGLHAWVMDDESAIDDWEHFRLRKQGDVLVKSIVNPNGYLENLNEGSMNSIMGGKKVVERTNDGEFSQQSPHGQFIQNGLENSFRKMLK